MDIKETNKRVIEQFRADGEIDGMRRDRLVLLTTVGAKSGLRRTTPIPTPSPGSSAWLAWSSR